ncbi:MAG: DUF4333 domain-containing protein [Mycobacteriaceae bacterium]|nr:DUF4333 domain-containing protein [Mycobacteriaceae bacterium]
MRTTVVISALAALALAGSGCSSEKSVDKNDVANTVSSKMNDKTGHKPDSVTCPDNLKASVGATMDCQARDSGQTFPVTVKVTNVDGVNVHYDINFLNVDKGDVVQAISNWAAPQLGHQPESVNCPGNLIGVVGVTMTCQLVDGGDTVPISVKVTSVDGTNVHYDIAKA